MQSRRTYVLDTSVLLSDPYAFTRFDEHRVVIPLVVIAELEGKRHHSELGWFARECLRTLEELRLEYRELAEPIEITPHGGTIQVDISTHNCVTGKDMSSASADAQILACTQRWDESHGCAVLVSKDLPLRVRAGSVSIDAEDFRHHDMVPSGYSGVETVEVKPEVIDTIHAEQELSIAAMDEIEIAQDREIPTNCGIVLKSGSSSALGRKVSDGSVQLVSSAPEAFGVKGRSSQQRIALDILNDSSIGIVSLGGRAGTGKSVLALCAGLEAVLERREHRRIMVFRPLYAVGGQQLGYLPGSEAEKMNPWAQAVFDTLDGVVSTAVIDEVMSRNMLEVLPLTHIRGRSLHDSFVIVDEAQSLERNVLLTVLSRLGRNSRVVLTHDVAQRDNLRVGRHDGVSAVVEKLKGHPLFAHVTLTRSERSPVAELVTERLADFSPGEIRP